MHRSYAIYIDIAFKDGTRMWGYTISFETGTHGWQFKAGVIDPEVAIHSLQVRPTPLHRRMRTRPARSFRRLKPTPRQNFARNKNKRATARPCVDSSVPHDAA